MDGSIGIPIQDNKTLSESNIKNGFKVLCVGSTLQEVLDINKTAAEDTKEERTQITTREPLCKQKVLHFGDKILANHTNS